VTISYLINITVMTIYDILILFFKKRIYRINLFALLKATTYAHSVG